MNGYETCATHAWVGAPGSVCPYCALSVARNILRRIAQEDCVTRETFNVACMPEDPCPTCLARISLSEET